MESMVVPTKLYCKKRELFSLMAHLLYGSIFMHSSTKLQAKKIIKNSLRVDGDQTSQKLKRCYRHHISADGC